MSGLVLSRKKDERIFIGEGPGQITLMVVEIRGDKVRLHIDAPRDVPVHREEVAIAIQREKLQVAEAAGDVTPEESHRQMKAYVDAKGLAGANAEQEMYRSGDHKQIHFPGSRQEG